MFRRIAASLCEAVRLLVGSCSLHLCPDTSYGEAPQPAPANETAKPQSPRLLANSNIKLASPI